MVNKKRVILAVSLLLFLTAINIVNGVGNGSFTYLNLSGGYIKLEKFSYYLGEPVLITLSINASNFEFYLSSGDEVYSYINLNNSIIFIPQKTGNYSIQLYINNQSIENSSFYVHLKDETSLFIDKNEYYLGETVFIHLNNIDENYAISINSLSSTYNFFGIVKSPLEFKPNSVGSYQINAKNKNNNITLSKNFTVKAPDKTTGNIFIHTDKDLYYRGEQVIIYLNFTKKDSYVFYINSEDSIYKFLGVLQDKIVFNPKSIGRYIVKIEEGDKVLASSSFSVIEKPAGKELEIFYLDKYVYDISEIVNVRLNFDVPLIEIVMGNESLKHYNVTEVITFKPQKTGNYSVNAYIENLTVSKNFTVIKEEVKQAYVFDINKPAIIDFNLRTVVDKKRSILNIIFGISPIEQVRFYVENYSDDSRFNLSAEQISKENFRITVKTDGINPETYMLVAEITVHNELLYEKKIFHLEKSELPQPEVKNESQNEAKKQLDLIKNYVNHSFTLDEDAIIDVDFTSDIDIKRSILDLVLKSSKLEQLTAFVEGHEIDDDFNLSITRIEFDKFSIRIKKNENIPADVYKVVAIGKIGDKTFIQQKKFNWGITNIDTLLEKINLKKRILGQEKQKLNLFTNKKQYTPREKVHIYTDADISQIQVQHQNITFNFFGSASDISFAPQSEGMYFVEAQVKGVDGVLTTNFSVGVNTSLSLPQKEVRPFNFNIKNGRMEKVSTNLKFYRNNTLVKIVEKGREDEEYGAPFEIDDYEVDIEPEDTSIKRLRIKNLKFNGSMDIGIDHISDKIKKVDKKLTVKVYAIDAININFTSATVTIKAKGTELYKCKDWDFESRSCQGSWEKYMDLIPGKEYSFNLTSGDPGFAETGLASINTNKSIYHPNEIVKIIMVVLDKEGHLVSGADIVLNVTNPNNVVSTFTISDDSVIGTEKGIYESIYTTTSLEGNYSMFVQAVANNVNSSMLSFFTIKQFYEFDILRNTPVTTDPFKAPFNSSIKIISFMNETIFSFVEVLPINFTNITARGALISLLENKTFLTWFGLANNSIVNYSALPPLVTPELWELGQSQVIYGSKVFTEARQWFLAVDPFQPPLNTSQRTCSQAWGFDCGNQANDDTFDGCPHSSAPDTARTVREIYLNVTVAKLGDYVNATCNYDGTGTGNEIEIWYNNTQGFYLLFNGAAPSGAPFNRTVEFTVNGSSGTHWLRCIIDQNGELVPCPTAGARDIDDVNFSVAQPIAPQFTRWNLSNETGDLGNGFNITRGAIITAYAQWNVDLNSSILEHNGNGTFVNFTLRGSFLPDNFTNFTLDTSNTSQFTNIGAVNITAIYGEDQGIYNKTTPPLSFFIYGTVEVSESQLDPSNIIIGNYTSMLCRVTDEKVFAPYADYNVTFWSNATGYLGHNLTNSNGWANLTFNNTVLGVNNITCNITANVNNYFYLSSTSSALQQLNVLAPGADTEKPSINSVSAIPSQFSTGTITTISANITDNIKVASVRVNITYPSSATSAFNMSLTTGDIYQYNFSDTSASGIYTYFITAVDNASPPNTRTSADFAFEAVGTRAVISVQTVNKSYKHHQNVNLTILSSTDFGNQESGIRNVTAFPRNTSTRTCTDSFGSTCSDGALDDTFDTCSAGTNQDRITREVYINSTRIKSGDSIKVTCEYDPANSGDEIEIWSYNGTDFTQIFSSNAPSGAIFNQSASATITSSIATQWFRCIIDASGEGVACPTAGRRDIDDANFTVDSNILDDDGNTYFINYTDIGNQNFTKISDIGLDINVVYYNSSGSLNASNKNPDLEIRLYDGSDYNYKFTCSLNSLTSSGSVVPINCSTKVKNSTVVSAWNNSLNRKLQIRGINFDESNNKNDIINWSGVFVLINKPSKIENFGITNVSNISAKVLLQVQFNNGTNWNNVDTIYNKSQTIRINQTINLSNLWSPFNTQNRQLGTYRAYAALTDTSGNVLQDENDVNLSDAYEFYLDFLRIIEQSPLNDSIQDANGFWANLTLNYTNFPSSGFCSYTIDNMPNVSMPNDTRVHFYNFTLNISEARHNITFYCNDTTGDMNYHQISFNATDQKPPNVTLSLPVDGDELANGNLTFAFNVTDIVSPIKNCTLEFQFADNQTNTSIIESANQSFKIYNLDNGGPYNWRIRCADNSSVANVGNSSYFDFVVGFDTDAPIITLRNPVDGYNTSNNDVIFDYRVNDLTSSIANCSLIINNKVNQTNTSVVEQGPFPYTFNNFTVYDMPDGLYNWSINCTDTSKNVNIGNSSTRRLNVTRDLDFPTINLINPPHNATDTDGIIFFEYNVTDASSNIANCSLFINNTLNLTTQSPSEVTTNTFSPTKFNVGVYNWKVNCTDDSFDKNNNVSETRNFTVSILNNLKVLLASDKSVYEQGTELNETAFIHVNVTDELNNPLNVNATTDIIKANTSLRWWNSSWQYRRPILITSNINKNLTNVTIGLNITNLTGKITNCANEIRIIRNYSLSFETTPFQVVSGDNSNYCEVIFNANISTLYDNDNRYYVYYGNSNAQNPNFIINTTGLTVQRGDASGTTTNTIINSTILPVDTDRAFVLFTSSTNIDDPDRIHFTPNLTKNQTSFTRYTAVTSSAISWQVVEHPDIQVQRGTVDFGASQTGANISISQVDLNKSFVVVYGKVNSATAADNSEAFFKGSFIDSTNITLERRTTGSTATVSYQVVEWQKARVLNGSLSVTSARSDVNINPINTSRSFLIFSRAISGDAGQDTNFVLGNITNSSGLSFVRVNGAGTAFVEWFVVELPNATVKTNSVTFSSDVDVAINPVAVNNTFHVQSQTASGGGTGYQNAQYKVNLTNSTNLLFDKTTTTNTNVVTWFVIDVSYFPVTRNISLGTEQKLIQSTINSTGSDGSVLLNLNTGGLGTGVYSAVAFVSATNYNDALNHTQFEIATDKTAPIVNLVSPNAEHVSVINNVTFIYNVSDTLSSIRNCSLIINNTINQTNTSITENARLNFTLTNLSNSVLSWNVNCTDDSANNNVGSATARIFTIAVDTTPPVVTLLNPQNNYTDTNKNVSFNYSVTDDFTSTADCTLYINNTANTTQLSIPIDGSTRTISNLTLFNNGSYSWYINCTDNSIARNFNTSLSRNFTVNEDLEGPIINLEFPSNGAQLTNENVTFRYNASDAISNVTSCSLSINGTLNQTNRTITQGISQNFTVNNLNGYYNWSINCTDGSENANVGNSVVRTLLIAPDVEPPIIKLEFPPNNIQLNTGNITFKYNVSDFASGIKNCSLYINQTLNLTNASVIEDISQNFTVEMQNGIYNWYVNCTDNSPNFNFDISETRNLTIGVDTTPPDITLQNPINNFNDTNGIVLFEYIVSDIASTIANCSVIINNTINQTNYSITELVTQNFTISGFNNGTYAWGVNCTDNSSSPNTGNSSSRLFNVKIDLESPLVNLVDPPNNTIDTNGNRIFYYNVSDTISTINNCSLVLNNEINQTNSSILEDTRLNFTVNGFNDGGYNWSVNCTDNSDNLNIGSSPFRLLTVTNDNVGPAVTLLAPANNSIDTNGNQTFNYSLSDVISGVASCTLRVGSSSYTDNTITESVTEQFNVTSLTTADYNWNITCTDDSENSNSATSQNRNLSVVIDNAAPVIKLITPSNYTQEVTNNITFFYNVSDTSAINSCSLIINGTVNQSNTSLIIKDSRLNFTVVNMSNGTFLWNVNCTDTSEDRFIGSSESRLLVVGPDVVGPVISLLNPPNNIQDPDGNVTFEYNVSDFASGIANCTLIVNGTINQTTPQPQEEVKLNFTLNNTALGDYTWQINCTDNSTNANVGASDTRNLTIGEDTTPPTITLISPSNNSVVNSKDSIFEYTTVDFSSNISNCSLIINDKINLTNTTISETSSNFFFLFDISDGNYNWSVNCTDGSPKNNTGSSSKFNLTVFAPKQIIAGIYTNATSYEQGNVALVTVNITNSSLEPFDADVYIDIIKGNTTVPFFDSSWNYRIPVDINTTNITRKNSLIELEVNFTNALINDIGVTGSTFDVNSIRVMEWKNNKSEEVVYQFKNNSGFNLVNDSAGTISWILNGTTSNFTIKNYFIYFDVTENGAKQSVDYSAYAPTFTFSGSSKTVVKDGISSNADYVRIYKGNESIALQFANGQDITNQQNIDYQGVGSIWNITLSNTRISNYYDSIIPVAIYNNYFLNQNGTANITSGAVYSKIRIPGYLNGTAGTNADLNYTIWFGEQEIMIKAELYVKFNQAVNDPLSLFNNLWFAYLFDYDSDWSSFIKLMNSTSFSQTHRYRLPNVDSDTTNQFNSGDWYSEYNNQKGSINLYVQKFTLNGASNTIGSISYDDWYNPAQSKTTESDGVGFNLNSDQTIAVGDTYSLTVWMILSNNKSSLRVIDLKNHIENPLNITKKKGEQLVNRTINASGSNGVFRFNWSTANRNVGNYTTTVIANKTLYILGVDYYNFEITQDITKPIVNAISPEGFINTENTTFTYNVSETNSLTNCSVIINNKINVTNSSVTNNAQNTIIVYNIAEGSYNWSINCSDAAGNIGNSSTKNITVDLSKPSITLSSPQNGVVLNYTSIGFNFTAIDNFDTLVACNVTIDSSVAANVNATNGTLTNVTIVVSQAIHNWNVTCQDDAGNINTSLTRQFTVDLGPPAVTLNSPANNSFVPISNITFFYTPNDLSLANCSLIINDVINQTNLSPTNAVENKFGLENRSEGKIQWSVNCTDSTNNIGSSATLNVYVDFTPPSITLLNPADGFNSALSNIQLNFTFIDNLDVDVNCNVTINGTVNNSALLTAYNNSIFIYNVSGLNDGLFAWNTTCFDSANNTNTSLTRSFRVNEASSIALIAPPNSTRNKIQNQNFTFIPNDNSGNISNCTLVLNNALNVTNATININVQNNLTVSTLEHNQYNWTVNCTDPSGNIGTNSSLFILYVDLLGPSITLNTPFQGQTFNQNNINFNFTPTDQFGLNTTLSCNLTLDGVVNASNISVISSNTNVTLINNLADGSHTWNVTCLDDLNNSNTSITVSFIINQPDLTLNTSNIIVNNTSPIEGDNITINATVFNIGGISANNILVRVYDGNPLSGGTQIDTDRVIASLDFGRNATINVTWTALLGLHEIFVTIDPNNAIAELNETNNNASKNITIPIWHAIAGNVTGNLLLQSIGNKTVFSWNISAATSGNIFVVDSDSSITWTNLTALGRNITEGNASNDWQELDTAINATSYSDSTNRTFTTNYVPINVTSFVVFANTIYNVSITNSTNSSNFVTGILWDKSDESGDGQFNGSEDVVFITEIKRSEVGRYGIYDFEIRVPSLLKKYKGSDVSSVTFYVELR